MNTDQSKVDYHIIGSDLCQILENHLPNTDSLLDIPSPDVGSSINSRLPSATAMVNSSSSELASCSNSSYRLEPPLGDRTNEFPAFIQPEVPSALAGPSSERPSTVTIVEQAGTAVKRQKPEEPLENMKFTAPREPLFELSHQVEQGRTAAKLLKPIAPPVIRKYEVHNYTMKQQIVVSFKDTTTILNDKGFGSAKQPTGGYSCEYCSKFMNDKKDMKMHIRTHHKKGHIFQCSLCNRRYVQKGTLKIHMLTIHKYIANEYLIAVLFFV